jgi:hypothetical protein
MQQGPWAGKRARRRTGLHTVLALFFLAAAAGAGYLVIVQIPKWLKGSDVAVTTSPSPSVSTLDPIPGCRSPGFPDFRSLGTVAWVQSGAIKLVDLPTCRQRTLVGSGGDGPVRFSGDGRWVAYGALSYVSASGGKSATVPDANANASANTTSDNSNGSLIETPATDQFANKAAANANAAKSAANTAANKAAPAKSPAASNKK